MKNKSKMFFEKQEATTSNANLTIAELVQISHHPEDAFYFPVPIQPCTLSEYEKRAMCALICNLVGIGVTDIGDVYKVGQVLSINVIPYRHRDPTLLICKQMNLSLYYEIWAEATGNKKNYNGWGYDDFVFSKEKFAEAIRLAVRSARSLSKDEIMFAIVEMLSFQNEMMCK